METPKEAAIRKAWIDEIGEECYNNIKYKISSEDGTCKADWFSVYTPFEVFPADKFEYDHRWNLVRPFTIVGIETNNNWNVFAEKLPAKDGMYHTAFMNHNPGFQLEHYFSVEHQRFFNKEGVKVFPTHWRKKETYPDPIY